MKSTKKKKYKKQTAIMWAIKISGGGFYCFRNSAEECAEVNPSVYKEGDPRIVLVKVIEV